MDHIKYERRSNHRSGCRSFITEVNEYRLISTTVHYSKLLHLQKTRNNSILKHYKKKIHSKAFEDLKLV